MRPELLVNVPLTKPLPSTNNLREHWAVKAKRVKEQRQQAAQHLAFSPSRVGNVFELRKATARYLQSRVVCTLTRIGPKRLDDDNLSGAFKAIRDEVAKQVGLDDGSPRWTWKYAQESGAPGYRIHLEVTAGLLTQAEGSR